ncbi:MAG TPA: DinB family protein [Thermomicrobiales bacterium]|jgi:uncharacterized damage-inducible protein DinB|nr:damage-inducible protein DinB [Chloroflexota bacterium]HBY47574.1 damage-inducible protein DinB [Chloroflexota bacterium]HCG29758.1 damage-inducible protein DinB [Chloroflexota bacterium]HQZ88570.1 DinB family protein [Thermomicrobiales bacterium]
MTQPESRRQLTLTLPTATDPAIAQWLAAAQDARARTLQLLDRIDDPALDWQRDDENTIGTLLYHIAAIETDWLYVEVLTEPFPDDIVALLPWDVRDASGRLTHVSRRSLSEHLTVLSAIRDRLILGFREMTIEDFLRPRALPEYDVTPAWVLHHLMQHEAEHRGQIHLLLTAYTGRNI